MSLPAFARLHPSHTGLVPGVDVSGNNPLDVVEAAAEWARFAWVKATQGAHFYEPGETAERVAVFARRGIPWGLYHFADPGKSGYAAAAEAALFSRAAVEQGAGQLPPVFDCERGDGILDGYALAALAGIETGTGRRPMLYSYAGFVSGHFTDPALAAYDLWLAHYASAGVDPWCPVGPWSQWQAWQWEDSTPEHGNLDVNVARPDWVARHVGLLAPASKEELTVAQIDELLAWLTPMNDKLDRVLVSVATYNEWAAGRHDAEKAAEQERFAAKEAAAERRHQELVEALGTGQP